LRRDLLGLDHLALGFERAIGAIKGVPDQHGGVAHDIVGVRDRIEIGQGRVWNQP
jgi:hypothetical protein